MGPEKAVSPCPAPSSPPCQGRGEHQQSSLSLPLAPETFTETQVSSFLLLREGNRTVNWKKQALWLLLNRLSTQESDSQEQTPVLPLPPFLQTALRDLGSRKAPIKVITILSDFLCYFGDLQPT